LFSTLKPVGADSLCRDASYQARNSLKAEEEKLERGEGGEKEGRATLSEHILHTHTHTHTHTHIHTHTHTRVYVLTDKFVLGTLPQA
jgi:hypothetical protein